MAHQYALHRDVIADCLCCHVARKFHFTARSDQVVCAPCRKHLGDRGDQIKQRERDHLGFWQADRRLLLDDHAHRVVALQTSVHDRDVAIMKLNQRLAEMDEALRTALSGQKSEMAAAWYETEKIKELKEHLERARGFIGRQFRVLWHIDDSHHPDDERDDDVCVCGKRRCEVSAAVGPFRSKLYSWEREQTERLKADLPHALPSDHPEVLRRQPWRQDRYPA